jgi:thiamine kinase-like enzyme
MGAINLVQLILELENRKKAFMEKHDKDNYIKFLEDKNSLLLAEFSEIFEENEELKKTIESLTKVTLSPLHLDILAYAAEHENTISNQELKRLFAKKVD